MFKRRSIVLFAFALATVLRAQTTIVYQVVPGANSKNNLGSRIGESFTTDSAASFITSLDIYINSNALATGNFTLSLYAVSGTAGSYTPAGSALFSNTYSNAILSSTIGTHYLFDNLSWSISGNTSYMVAFESSSSATIKWQAATSSETANLLVGTSGQNRYISPNVVSGSYHAMTVTTSAIPEPGTYAALFGAAALGLAVYRRRRA